MSLVLVFPMDSYPDVALLSYEPSEGDLHRQAQIDALIGTTSGARG
jgi:hypothetical protein